jgi:heat shock protein HslJ
MRNLTLGVAALLFFSCSESTNGPDERASVEGSWDLRSFEFAGGPVGTVVEPGIYTAEFAADGHVSARADCNRCSASYSVAGPLLTNLEIGALACTRAYCGDESLFDDYVVALDDATSFERSSSSLVIRHPRGSLHFVPKS